jgi:hypothetical protein
LVQVHDRRSSARGADAKRNSKSSALGQGLKTAHLTPRRDGLLSPPLRDLADLGQHDVDVDGKEAAVVDDRDYGVDYHLTVSVGDPR